MEKFGERSCKETIDGGAPLVSVIAELRKKFSARVILVNHAPGLKVDVPCSNLSIKYNMLYISAYQLIKNHICGNTELGQRLKSCRKQVELVNNSDDSLGECEFNPAHFDLHLVMEVIADCISKSRTDQQFILLEGLCNNSRLAE